MLMRKNLFDITNFFERYIAEGNDINAHNAWGTSFLFLAVDFNRFDIVRLLVEKYNADINVFDCAGDNPILLARRRGYSEIDNYLVGKKYEKKK